MHQDTHPSQEEVSQLGHVLRILVYTKWSKQIEMIILQEQKCRCL